MVGFLMPFEKPGILVQFSNDTTRWQNVWILNTVEAEIQQFEIRKHFKSGLFEGRIPNGWVFKWLRFSNGYSYSPKHLKTGPFKIQKFLSGFQMVLDKMQAIFLDFKWLGFQISDTIQNFATQPLCDHSKSRLSNPDFRSPLYLVFGSPLFPIILSSIVTI